MTRMEIMATKRPHDSKDSRRDRRTARALFWRLDAKGWVRAFALLCMISKSFLQTLVPCRWYFAIPARIPGLRWWRILGRTVENKHVTLDERTVDLPTNPLWLPARAAQDVQYR